MCSYAEDTELQNSMRLGMTANMYGWVEWKESRNLIAVCSIF